MFGFQNSINHRRYLSGRCQLLLLTILKVQPLLFISLILQSNELEAHKFGKRVAQRLYNDCTTLTMKRLLCHGVNKGKLQSLKSKPVPLSLPSLPRHTALHLGTVNHLSFCYRCNSTTTVASSHNTKYSSVPIPVYDVIPSKIANVVDDYAQHQPTIISLAGLIQKTKDITSSGNGRLARRLEGERGLMNFAQLLKQELPIRLAHRIQDLDMIPYLRDMPSVQKVKGVYIHSFQELLEIENPTTPALETKFGHLLHELYQNHSQVLLQMAKGAWEFKSQIGDPDTFDQHEECHDFLNRFYASRVGIRVLAGQYLAVRQQWSQELKSFRVSSTPSKHYIGMICQEASPYEIVQLAIKDATRLCVSQFGRAPKIVVRGRLDLTFPYIPTHLHYIVLELLKNALRATVEHHYNTHEKINLSPLSNYEEFPEVVVIIADNTENEDVIIKISDQGGGIPRSQMEKIWSYLFTTANPNIQSGFLNHQQNDSLILAGLGYGLPMSRAYARYFCGDLDLISMEGYGTDVRKKMMKCCKSEKRKEWRMTYDAHVFHFVFGI